MEPAAEKELLARCRQGDTDAWDELFDLHYAPVGRFVLQLGLELTREDAQEVCQETFLSVIKHLDSFKGGSRFQTWAFRIASNKSRDFIERRRAARRGGGQAAIPLHTPENESGPTIDPPSPAPGPDAGLISAEQNSLIQESLAEMEVPCREIIELRYFGDLSYEEISRELELNVKTVSSRLSKCLDRLESILKTKLSRGSSAGIPSNLQVP
jgi:RNA polymerase sigma-70 factor (ECF subfamily)